jgi:hypothetical protein
MFRSSPMSTVFVLTGYTTGGLCSLREESPVSIHLRRAGLYQLVWKLQATPNLLRSRTIDERNPCRSDRHVLCSLYYLVVITRPA